MKWERHKLNSVFCYILHSCCCYYVVYRHCNGRTIKTDNYCQSIGATATYWQRASTICVDVPKAGIRWGTVALLHIRSLSWHASACILLNILDDIRPDTSGRCRSFPILTLLTLVATRTCSPASRVRSSYTGYTGCRRDFNIDEQLRHLNHLYLEIIFYQF